MQYGLNDEQWAAITARSPTMVNASAGSGKTRCLVAKIMHLIDNGISPKNILAITFTNKAANEMKDRLKKIYDIREMQISTIHSMCVKIIKAFINHTYLKLPFSIYDDGDQENIIKTILKSRNFSENHKDVTSIISRAKSEDGTNQLEGNIAVVYKQYQEILKKNNACDFDDLLIYARDCLKHNDCREHFIKIWNNILVDEMQDISKIQYDIILSIYDPQKTQTMFSVGDANQAIYTFRGARPNNMRDFINKYHPTVKNLTYNYRSCSSIINHANSFLQYGKPMIAKSDKIGQISPTVFRDREEEAEKIGRAIQTMGRYEETAILYRVNARSIGFEQTFSRMRIPYKVVGALPFFKRRVIKDLICGLRAATNKSDIEALARVINNPRRGFGDRKKEKLLTEGRSYINSLSDEMPQIKDFLELLDDIKNMRPLSALNEYINRTGYMQTLTKDNDIQLVETLRDVITQYDTINDLILASSFLEDDTGSGVKLMTAHASKGLEFDRVFIVGVEEGVWPHEYAEDLAEEKRLFYVACTRAKKYLNISYSKRRNYRGSLIETESSSLFNQFIKFFKQNYGS